MRYALWNATGWHRDYFPPLGGAGPSRSRSAKVGGGGVDRSVLAACVVDDKSSVAIAIRAAAKTSPHVARPSTPPKYTRVLTMRILA